MQLPRRKIPQTLNEACDACPLEPNIDHSRLQENIGMIHKLDTDWMNGPKNLFPTIQSRQSELVNPVPPISGQNLICEDRLKGGRTVAWVLGSVQIQGMSPVRTERCSHKI